MLLCVYAKKEICAGLPLISFSNSRLLYTRGIYPPTHFLSSLQKQARYDRLPPMKIRYAERVDALCHRHCAFALYTLPDEHEVHFCMAKDGRSEENIILSNGFLLSTFTGQQLFIPAELTEPPVADTWEKSLPPTHGEASTREQYAALFELYTEFIRNGRVSKIVLARTEDTPVRQDFSPTEAFLKACNQHPSAYKALVHTPQHGTWLLYPGTTHHRQRQHLAHHGTGRYTPPDRSPLGCKKHAGAGTRRRLHAQHPHPACR